MIRVVVQLLCPTSLELYCMILTQRCSTTTKPSSCLASCNHSWGLLTQLISFPYVLLPLITLRIAVKYVQTYMISVYMSTYLTATAWGRLLLCCSARQPNSVLVQLYPGARQSNPIMVQRFYRTKMNNCSFSFCNVYIGLQWGRARTDDKSI